MESHRKKHHPTEDQKQAAEPSDSGEAQNIKEAAPGIPIIRSNTPKPLTLGMAQTADDGQEHWARYEEQIPANFPSRAPSAPPLPEEYGEHEELPAISSSSSIPLPRKTPVEMEEQQEFVWLFEYGLEMDPAMLNSAERLDGLALLYGPAVLRGYSVLFGQTGLISEQTIITVVSDYKTGAEVWGVLYRIPRRVTERIGETPSLLDSIHNAGLPQGLLKTTQVVVYETYRGREISNVTTYTVAENVSHQFHFVVKQDVDALVQRLAAVARKQKLPDSYLKELATRVAPAVIEREMVSVEQNTEPLSMLGAGRQAAVEKNPVRLIPVASYPDRWLIAFALYLVGLLLAVLALAIVQGLGIGSMIFTPGFTPLNVPWFVLLYGLLGGCISCLVTLGYCQALNPPSFVVITWFTRPYIGAALALFAYLLLNSGVFALSASPDVRNTIFMLVGGIAGLCEGCIFLRRYL